MAYNAAMISLLRSSIPVLMLTASLAAPTAAIAQPTVAYPTRQALATGTASFQVTQEATGRVNGIFVSDKSARNSSNTLESPSNLYDGENIYGIPMTSSLVKMVRPVYAGTHYWMYSWLPVNADGTTGTLQYSDVNNFFMPVVLRAVTAGALYQDATRAQAGISGLFTSNAKKELKVVCRISKGAKTVTIKRNRALVAVPMSKTRWSCLDMRIPESYDGSRLKLTVTVTGDGKVATTTKSFTAK